MKIILKHKYYGFIKSFNNKSDLLLDIENNINNGQCFDSEYRAENDYIKLPINYHRWHISYLLDCFYKEYKKI